MAAKTSKTTTIEATNGANGTNGAHPPAALAVAMMDNDHRRLQAELQTLFQRKQENEKQRIMIDTAIAQQQGAIAYVEMVLQRAQESEKEGA